MSTLTSSLASSTTSSVTVVPASPADLDEAAALLARAFADEPQVAAVVGARAGAEARRFRLFRAELAGAALPEGTLDLARDPDDGALLGVAAWHAPEASSRVRAVRSLRSLLVLPDHLRAFGADGVRRALAVRRALGAARPAASHWYLEAVGVAPAGRGRGIGGALLQRRLDLLDRAGSGEPAYLESSSPRTTPLYRRLGFLPLGPVRGLPSAQPPLAMWRPAGGAAGWVASP